jgi:3',5'-cyclic AMP phosphodiesterase CpdA
MITLAHLSDVHLSPLPPARIGELINKRLTGYLNYRLHRGSALDGSGLETLVRHLQAQNPDFICLTGDLVNLALDSEIASAAEWLHNLAPPEKLCISPGNHDAYLPGTLTRACGAWRPYLSGETIDEHRFPFVRRVGGVAIVSCSSAISTPPWVAAGRFSESQGQRLTRILRLLAGGDYFRVVMIHHPPEHEERSWRRGLWGAEHFRHALAEAGAELVLHGHTHRSTMYQLPGPKGEVPVVGVAAASTAPEARRADPARYNLFRIERHPKTKAWTCTMREYGYQRLGSDIALRLEMKIC